MRLKLKRAHKEAEIAVRGANGSDFRVLVRQSTINVLDFSVVLGCLVPKASALFRLRRYNGRSHEHTNRIEGARFFEFHVHTATERYQDLGMKEDSYAEATSRFSDLDGAVRALVADCGFEVDPGAQLRLFDRRGR